MKNLWITGVVIGLALLGGLAFVHSAQDTDATPEASDQAAAPGAVQPIQFPHDLHAETYQIDCQYCHFSAERSVDAGIPSVETCMGCHTLIQGTEPAQQAEIDKLEEYWAEGEPIPWVRIYKVADHVHFPHMRHVSAGVACQQCHGEVQTMGVLEERSPVWKGDNMGWCVSCHVEMDVSRDCTVCHY